MHVYRDTFWTFDLPPQPKYGLLDFLILETVCIDKALQYGLLGVSNIPSFEWGTRESLICGQQTFVKEGGGAD